MAGTSRVSRPSSWHRGGTVPRRHSAPLARDHRRVSGPRLHRGQAAPALSDSSASRCRRLRGGLRCQAPVNAGVITSPSPGTTSFGRSPRDPSSSGSGIIAVPRRRSLSASAARRPSAGLGVRVRRAGQSSGHGRRARDRDRRQRGRDPLCLDPFPPPEPGISHRPDRGSGAARRKLRSRVLPRSDRASVSATDWRTAHACSRRAPPRRLPAADDAKLPRPVVADRHAFRMSNASHGSMHVVSAGPGRAPASSR